MSDFNESVRGQVVFLVAKVNMPYEHFFEMLMTVDAARRSSAKEVVLIIPYLPHSRQERRDGQRTSISSRMVADIIQLTGAGSESSPLTFIPMQSKDSIKYHLIPSLTSSICGSHQEFRNGCLVSLQPDFGGIKRIKQYKKHLDAEIAVINKERIKPNPSRSYGNHRAMFGIRILF